MEFLEQLWEIISNLFSAIGRGFERALTSFFGSSNARFIKKLQPRIDAINALETKYQAMSDSELMQQTAIFRQRLAEGATLDDLLNEAFAVCREAGRRFLGMRHYDVQLIGGMVLHSGSIAEMITGEGKTLVATLPAYLNALEGKGVHVVTVNDYLARRDMEWMAPIYMNLGLTVGAIQSGMDSAERQAAYACDITYGTNNEFGFDYLRDNMRPAARDDRHFPKHMQQAQGTLNFAIIDEVDNILLDESRTPLIISGPAHDDVTKYGKADKVARQLIKDAHFEVKEKEHTVALTDDGVRAAEKLAGVESFYTAGHMEWPHLIDNALKAHHLYKRDVNYVVENGEIIIVDEFTGRKMPGRQWSDGLHQAVEAKEGVQVKEETQTLATITLQNFFKLYKKICGMTGTAMTEANEFWKIYKLDVIAIPSNRQMQRINSPDVIYLTEKEKYHAVADEIERIHKWDTVDLGSEWRIGQILSENDQELELDDKESRQREKIPRSKIKSIQKHARPILVGTVSIEKSERLSALLERRGIKHQVLNAKHHKREAEIVAQAGRKGAVTIATNMAGRGTDIILGGNAEAMAWALLQDKYPTRLEVPPEEWDTLVREIEAREKTKTEGAEVKALGGLHIIGTERHDARRIDNQLRGRSGRQGDPGSSRFYLSLEDDLMRIFAGEWVKSVLTRLGMKEGEAIESRMVSRRIEGAQKKVEERNFDIRKNLLEYDEVMDEQRKRVYSYRQNILDGGTCKRLILEMIDRQIEQNIDVFLQKDYGAETFAKWAGSLLSVELDAREFRGLDFGAAEREAKDQAERMAESQVFEAIEENLPEGEEEDWNWEALAKFANVRWSTNLRDRDLKKVGRDGVSELLIEQGKEAINKIDLTEGQRFLEPDFGMRTACAWVQYKFGIPLDFQAIRTLELQDFKDSIRQKTSEVYDEKEAAYPVMAGFYRFTHRDLAGQKHYDRTQMVTWARERFHVDLSFDDFKNKSQDDIRPILVAHSRESLRRAAGVRAELERLIEDAFANTGADHAANGAAARVVAGSTTATSSLQTLIDQLKSLDSEVTDDEIKQSNREQLQRLMSLVADEHFRPEMRRMERALVLQILDTAWKDHLLAMDHLRSSVNLRGYAQVDPKVEYKREGMKLFEAMWLSIGDRVTDLFFKMEQLDESFVGSTWKETAAIHEEAPSQSDIGQQQQSAIDNSQNQAQKIEPIRNRGEKIGRNDPCPCNSGKKYKNCCMRKGGGGIAASIM
ncbi:MAG: SEC-C domain-containing protein [Pirellulales bacterium]|nr:SEC-C domain-containing protein [Pirellulales bacterium]